MFAMNVQKDIQKIHNIRVGTWGQMILQQRINCVVHQTRAGILMSLLMGNSIVVPGHLAVTRVRGWEALSLYRNIVQVVVGLGRQVFVRLRDVCRDIYAVMIFFVVLSPDIVVVLATQERQPGRIMRGVTHVPASRQIRYIPPRAVVRGNATLVFTK